MASASLILNLLVRSDGSNTGAMAGVRVGLEGIAIAAAAVTAGLVTVVNTGAEFDAVMNQVGAATNASAEGMAELRDLAYEMGSATAFSASEAGDAMLELARSGMTEAQIKGGALQATLVLASAGQLELGDAAAYTANTLNMFALDAGDAGAVAAALAGAANASSASVADLGFGLAAVGPAAFNAGLSLQETTAVLALFSQNGLQGSDAGTSLKSMLMNLVPSTDAAAGAMRELGLNFVDAEGNFLSIAEISEQLRTKLGHLSESQRMQALETIFGSDAMRAAAILMREGGTAVEEMTAATSDLEAAQRMADVNTQGMKGAMEALGGAVDNAKLALWELIDVPAEDFARDLTAGINEAVEAFRNMDFGGGIDSGGVSDSLTRIRDLFREIGESLRDSWNSWVLPTIRNVADLLDPLLFNAFQVVLGAVRMVAEVFENVFGPAIREATEFLAEHETAVGALVAGFAAFATVGAMIGGAVTAFWALNSAIGAVRTAFTLLMAASPLGIFVAIAAAIGYAYTQSETFRGAVNALGRAIADAFQWAWEKVREFWGVLQGVFDWVRGNWQNLALILTGPFGAAVTLIRSNIDSVKGAVSGIWDGLTNGVDAVRTRIIAAFSGLAQQVREGIRSVLSAVGNPIADLFMTWLNGAGGVLASVWRGLVSIFDSFISLLNRLIGLWNRLPIVPDIPQISTDMPFLAEGGNITAAGMAIVGDAGPELLELPRGARVTPLDSSGGLGGRQDVHVFLHLPGDDDFATAMRRTVSVRGGDVTVLGV